MDRTLQGVTNGWQEAVLSGAVQGQVVRAVGDNWNWLVVLCLAKPGHGLGAVASDPRSGVGLILGKKGCLETCKTPVVVFPCLPWRPVLLASCWVDSAGEGAELQREVRQELTVPP